MAGLSHLARLAGLLLCAKLISLSQKEMVKDPARSAGKDSPTWLSWQVRWISLSGSECMARLIWTEEAACDG